jgi:CDP-6-deoxy-D-xylo-4-hexulose-3-dehydrase
MLKTRRRNARHLQATFKIINSMFDNPFKVPEILDGNEHAWMMFPLVTSHSKVNKKELTDYLNENLIETRDMMPIVSQPIYEDMLVPADYPVAHYIDRHGFYIGCHQDITPDDVEYIKQVVIEFFYKDDD